ncbi:MAG: hypothetical protein GC136_06480 [Alphaproteobacteria bacterium]|nr:hypothetical protein [Alphaproteobacteria bacterium]
MTLQFTRILYLLALFLLPLSVVPLHSASATDVTEKDVLTIARTIGFLQNAPKDDVVLHILYDPAVPTSAREAQDIYNLADRTKGAIKLRPKLITIGQITALQNRNFVFVTSGMQGHSNVISSHLTKHDILSFALERPCIERKSCVVYINTGAGRVEIVVDKEAAESQGISFKPVFLMMVTTL